MAVEDGGLEVRVRVPAKVNLFLAVRGVRDDGYHELSTVLQTVGLYDELSARLAGPRWARQHPAARKLMRLSLTHDAGPGVPTGDDNLVLRAGRKLLCRLWHAGGDGDCNPEPDPNAPVTELELVKRIPTAAGMAGGSADAAATLLALDRLWGSEVDDETMRDVAARLGSDVPFCLSGGTALATGTGADTASVLVRGQFHWVVCCATEGLSTPDVYRQHDELDRPPSTVEPDAVLQALRTGDALLLADALHNDLQDAAIALRPSLADDLERVRSAGALAAIVSGSGPTVVGLAPDERAARAIAADVADGFGRVEVVRSPAGGPRLAERVLQPA